MKKLSLLLMLIIPGFILSAQEKPSDYNWVQLFNGKDLNNWQVKIAGFNAGEN